MHAHKWLTLSVIAVLLLALAPAAATAVPPEPEAGPARGAATQPGVAQSDGRPAAVLPLSPGSLAYGTNTVNNQTFSYFDVDTPGTVNTIIPYSTLIFAGDFIGWNQSKAYAIRSDNKHLITLDTATGAETDLGALPLPPGTQHYNGMAYDPVSGNTYVSSCDGSTSYLYLLDVATPTVTQIGEITNSPCTTAIAVDDYGNLWGEDLVYDILLKIDKNTGAGLAVGPLGFDAGYEQGMDWDSASDQLYLAAFNPTTMQGELRIADTMFGGTTLVGPIGDTTMEFGWLAIAGLPPPPDIEVTPSGLSQELRPNVTATQALTICNAGPGSLSWTMSEVWPTAKPDSSEVTLPGSPSPAALTAPPYVLLLAADGGSHIQGLLEAYGDLASVDYLDARYYTPSLAELQAYDVVVTWSNSVYDDPDAIGDVLADYVDEGGKVINLMFSIGTNDFRMRGRFMEEHYTAMNGASPMNAMQCLGSRNGRHPIMAGIDEVCDFWRSGGTYLTPHSSDIARWTDGTLFVAAKDNQTVVTLNGYVGDGGHVWTGQMPDVLHNAILWLGADMLWLSEAPTFGDVAAGECATVTVTFDTAGVPVGYYHAGLLMWGNDPAEPHVIIPVSLTVAVRVYLPIVNKAGGPGG